VFHRSGTTRLFEFDKDGNFLREIGKGYYGFEFAPSVRVDKDDNIWTAAVAAVIYRPSDQARRFGCAARPSVKPRKNRFGSM